MDDSEQHLDPLTATSSSHLPLSSGSSLQKFKNHDNSIPCKSFTILKNFQRQFSKFRSFHINCLKENSTTSPSYLSLAEVYSHCTDEPDQINSIRMDPKVWKQING